VHINAGGIYSQDNQGRRMLEVGSRRSAGEYVSKKRDLLLVISAMRCLEFAWLIFR
jgi:hypothetical protein